MAIYNGRLWLVPDRLSEVSVEIQLDDERLRIVSRGTLIGDWPLSDVQMEYRDHDIHLFVEGEELVVWSHDPGFAPDLLGSETVDVGSSPRVSSHRGAHRSRRRARWWGRPPSD